MASRDLTIVVNAKGAANASRELNKVTKSVKGVGVAGIAVGTALGGVFDRAASKGIQLAFDSLNEASDLAETQSKIGVVFGQSGPAILKWGKTTATALGLSENAAESAAGTYGNLFVALKIGKKPAADMSVKLVKLAADLASFNNVDPSEALDALQSGLVGETEPLRKFGINLNDATLRQKALAMGLVKTTKTVLPPSIKAQAAYALIMEQSKTAQGDFARTSGGLANQQRILRAQLKNTGAVIGTALLPKVTELVTKVNKFVSSNQGQIADLASKLPGIADALGGIVGGIPWEAAGEALKLMGMGSKALLDAFTSMPPWVQTAVLTGWGLNKLTGGAVTGLIGELGKGLVKGVLGMNAGVVNINAAVVNGGGAGGVPGVPAAGGGGGGIVGAAKGLLKASIVGGVVVFGVDGVLRAANDMDAAIDKNNALAAQGLTADEITAQKYYSLSAADQVTATKRLMGHIPSKADLASGNAKIVAAQNSTKTAAVASAGRNVAASNRAGQVAAAASRAVKAAVQAKRWQFTSIFSPTINTNISISHLGTTQKRYRSVQRTAG